MGQPVDDALILQEQATPSTPPATTLAIYAKSDDNLYKQNSAGVEAMIGGGGGAPLVSYTAATLSLTANTQTLMRRMVLDATTQVIIPSTAELVFV